MTKLTVPTIGPDRGQGPHLDDAELLRDIDGEPPARRDVETPSHLRACDVCAARRAALVRRRHNLAVLLTRSDAGAPPALPMEALVALAHSRHRQRFLRAAIRVAAVLLVTTALAAQPAVRRWAGRQWTRVAGRRESAPIAVAPPSSVEGGVLAFVPAAGPFTIQFDVPPDAGTLTIIGDTGSRATVERIGGEHEDLLVTPSGLRVRNAGRGTASYVVRVPIGLERITVRLGARSPDAVVDLRRDSTRVLTFGRR